MFSLQMLFKDQRTLELRIEPYAQIAKMLLGKLGLVEAYGINLNFMGDNQGINIQTLWMCKNQ